MEKSKETESARDKETTKGKASAKKPGKGLFIAIAVIVLAVAAAVGVLFWMKGRVVKEVTVEAGNELTEDQLLAYGKQHPVITAGLTESQKRIPGNYTIEVKLAPFTYQVEVHLTDTQAPTATPKEVEAYFGGEYGPEDFVTDIADATAVRCEFVKAPDYTVLGSQEVQIRMTDAGANETIVNASLWYGNITSEVTIEAGSDLPMPGDYLGNYSEDVVAQAAFREIPAEIFGVSDEENAGTGEDAAATEGSEKAEATCALPGDYTLILLAEGREIPVTLHVQDTTPPELTVADKRVNGWTVKGLSIEDFDVQINDVSSVVYYFAEEPDWTVEGEGTAVIIAMDEAGNTSEATVTYALKKDTKAPELAVSIIDTTLGKAISYKKAANYSDNADSKDELTLDVDNSAVDLNKEGTYDVIYTVTDTSGNSTTVTCQVRVWAELPVYYDVDEVNRLADEVLGKIITADMTPLEIVRAIYKWVRANVGYVSHSEKGDYVRGAYEGLVLKKGDCFVFAATTKILLTRAGIENMDIIKSTVNPSHYWNLVNLGEGWYHLDTTPRKDGSTFFMLTDAELKEYSENHKNTHIYDESLYPEIN